MSREQRELGERLLREAVGLDEQYRSIRAKTLPDEARLASALLRIGELEARLDGALRRIEQLERDLAVFGQLRPLVFR